MCRKGCGRKWSWLNLRQYPGILLAGLRKITTKLTKGVTSPGRDLKPEPPGYKAGMPTARSKLSISVQQGLGSNLYIYVYRVLPSTLEDAREREREKQVDGPIFQTSTKANNELRTLTV
jgi:hypothetical protein